MTETATIYQCPDCLRLFADGQWLAPRLCVPESRPCGAEDCAAVVAENRRREMARLALVQAARRARFEKLKAEFGGHRPAESRKARPSCSGQVARLPYKDNDDGGRTGEEPPRPAGAVTAREFTQRDFVESGAAASQNAKLLEFFDQPQNLGQWFSGKFLEDLSGATRMNNRAIDLRTHYLPHGLYIDNCMISNAATGAKRSHYRICKIADAVSLSAEQKREFLATDEHR